MVVYFDKGGRAIEKEFKDFISTGSNCTESLNFLNTPIPSDYASAFIDLDADCQNDVVIHYKDTLEIWRGGIEDGNVKYCLSLNSVYKLEDKLGHFSIADVDRNGMLDIIFPIKDSASVLIGYNKLEIVYDWSADYCQSHKTIGFNSANEIFDRMIINSNTAVFNFNIVFTDNQFGKRGREVPF
jgi:hypothetical protein